MGPDNDAIREAVRTRYAEAAVAATRAPAQDACCGPDLDSVDAGFGAGITPEAPADDGERFGLPLYDAEEVATLPPAAALASLGCGNPTAVAELRAGEVVLDLGSGGGIDVLLSARRVGPTGFAYGLDMTEEMLELAERNAAEAGVDNVAFLAGEMEHVPLGDDSVDVIISNCVINLSTDKPAVLAEMHRVLVPGGRIGVSDVIADDHLTAADRAERGPHVGCIAGALSESEYRQGLAAVGMTDVEVVRTHEVADGMHGAIIRARKPV